MTVRQAYEYVDACRAGRERQFKEQAVLMQGQAEQILSGINCLLSKKAEFVHLWKLYPNLFHKKEQKISTDGKTPEQIQALQTKIWQNFLGVS